MIDIRVRDIGKMLLPDWTVEVDEDGAIWVQSPDVLDEADAITIGQQIIRELEQPLTLRYYIKLANKAAYARAQETATSYGLVLVPVGDDVFHVVTKAAFDSGDKAAGTAAQAHGTGASHRAEHTGATGRLVVGADENDHPLSPP